MLSDTLHILWAKLLQPHDHHVIIHMGELASIVIGC